MPAWRGPIRLHGTQDDESERLAHANAALRRTELTQPALFVIEYALAQLWMSWGVKPAALYYYFPSKEEALELGEVGRGVARANDGEANIAHNKTQNHTEEPRHGRPRRPRL